MIAVVVLSVLCALLAGALVVGARSVLAENRRLVNLLVAENPREFAALQKATDPAEEHDPVAPPIPSIVPRLGDGERLVGMS